MKLEDVQVGDTWPCGYCKKPILITRAKFAVIHRSYRPARYLYCNYRCDINHDRSLKRSHQRKSPQHTASHP